MSFLVELDQSLFLYLNSFHNEFWDMVMLMITRKEIWSLLYLAFIWLIIKNYGLKSIPILIAIILAITFSDQVSVFFKETIQRYRPTHDPNLKDLVHNIFRKGSTYGFFSSHASNTFTIAYLTSRLFNHKAYSITVFIWASLVSYTRIYLGVHFPLDILVGMAFGILTGFLFYKLLVLAENKLVWVRLPKISDTKISRSEYHLFLLVLIVSLATIMLVIGRLQHYNFL